MKNQIDVVVLLVAKIAGNELEKMAKGKDFQKI